MSLERALRAEEQAIDALHDTSIVQQLVPEWRCRVLIVDDDEIIRAQLSAVLDSAHYEVEVAASGEEAMKLLDASEYQIVLTDWQMPGMDGLALCRKVRLEHLEGYVYVMMLTIREGEQHMLSSLAAGADDYLVKGSTNEEILARMEVARRITHLECSLRQSNRENRRLSVTDALTGTNNRRYLMKYLPRELARAKRYERPLCVLCCDIDGFKQVNDRLGHAAGDYVLKEFVSRATRCIRETSDWLARSGGDEFVVVMPETDLMGAKFTAQKLRRVLTSPPLIIHDLPLKMTVSVGVAALEAHSRSDTTALDLLLEADQGLYVGKQLGREAARTTRLIG